MSDLPHTKRRRDPDPTCPYYPARRKKILPPDCSAERTTASAEQPAGAFHSRPAASPPQPSAPTSQQPPQVSTNPVTRVGASQQAVSTSGQQTGPSLGQQSQASTSATASSEMVHSTSTDSALSSAPSHQPFSLPTEDSQRETSDATESTRQQSLRKGTILTTVTSRIILSMPCGPPSSCVSTLEWWKTHTDRLEAKIGALLWALQEADEWKKELTYMQSLARSIGVPAVVPAAPWPPVKDEEKDEGAMQMLGEDKTD